MAYDRKLGERIRAVLADLRKVEEKEMMGGLVFMLNGKMCIGIIKDEMLCRIDPDIKESLLEKDGCHEMKFTGRPMKSYVLVDQSAIKTKRNFDYWIGLCLAFNKKAKASKKK